MGDGRRIVPVRKFRHSAWMYHRMQRYKATVYTRNQKRPKLWKAKASRNYLPGFSGISTLRRASRPSPISARSATKRNLPKFMFAPLTTATKRFFCPIKPLSMIYRLRPARASAPAGSVIDLVSVVERRCQIAFS